MVQDHDQDLRSVLKRETREEHQRLDDTVGSLALGNAADYARFLAIQYEARRPIEQWFAARIEDADIPPPQCDLLAADLHELGHAFPEPSDDFTCDAAAYPGIAWVLAGSSMGNRLIRKQRSRSGLDGPDRFLSSPQMPLYFQHLLSKLKEYDAPEVGRAAVAGAKIVFARFQAVADSHLAGHEL